ncbi:MAG: FAD-dependent oxidoreductase [Actinobacteria bacterium]|nr:FAD-dependent oxidoreductase [Actinomycetota bacterium]
MSGAVAVVGSGVSGLVTARELHRAGRRVTLFEADSRIGGHSHTVEVETDTGSWAVDTGFIVLNDRNYPGLESMLGELGVTTQPAPMSFSVSDGGGFEWSTRPLGLVGHRHLFDPRYGRMLVDLVRFFRDSRELIGTNGAHGSLLDFCRARSYSDYFVERVIVPQVSAIWSAHADGLGEFPASFLAEFFDNHRALQVFGRPGWRSVVGGSRKYVEAVTAPLRHALRPSTPVRELRRHPDRVEVVSDDGVEAFDQVVLAVHSDQALAMLAEPSRAEREVLGAIPYQRNEVALHTDVSVMPNRRRAWGSWNFHLGPGQPEGLEAGPAAPPGRTTVTYWMNALQRLEADREFLVTLNRTQAVDPAKLIKLIEYSHPVYTAGTVAAQRRWEQISGRDRVHYCGAYWGWGFHEDGVQSALRVVERLNPPRYLPSVRATSVETIAA